MQKLLKLMTSHFQNTFKTQKKLFQLYFKWKILNSIETSWPLYTFCKNFSKIWQMANSADEENVKCWHKRYLKCFSNCTMRCLRYNHCRSGWSIKSFLISNLFYLLRLITILQPFIFDASKQWKTILMHKINSLYPIVNKEIWMKEMKHGKQI